MTMKSNRGCARHSLHEGQRDRKLRSISGDSAECSFGALVVGLRRRMLSLATQMANAIHQITSDNKMRPNICMTYEAA